MLITGGLSSEFDTVARARLFRPNDPEVAKYADFFTWMGGWQILTGVTVAAALYLMFVRRRRAALLLITVILGRLIVELQKMLVDRDRPDLPQHLEMVHSMSFPSVHAANAMITYLTLALLLPVRQRLRAFLAAIAIALSMIIGWSRIAAGANWPSDVVGGWAFGGLWVLVCMRLAVDRPGD